MSHGDQVDAEEVGRREAGGEESPREESGSHDGGHGEWAGGVRRAWPGTKAKKRLPAATIRALKELEAGKLNRYADADDMFQKLGIKLGKEDKA
jgi:hypothetical protein